MKVPLPSRLTLVLAAVIGTTATLPAQDSKLRFGDEVSAEVDRIYERGLAWLAKNQGDDGSWKGSGQSGPGVDGICVMAFLASGEEPNFGRWAEPIRKGLQSIIRAQEETSGYIPSSMYHHGFATLALAEAYGAVDEDLLWRGADERGPSIAKVLERAIDCAATSQKKNRWGGWRYGPNSRDADTSVSGAVLMGLLAARNAGMEVPDETVDGALDYFRRSTNANGFVAYSGGIGGMGQSMNRACIATLVYAIGRQKEDKKYAATAKHITSQLEHQESSYPEYFRYYMAQALFQCDYEAWKKWNAQTVRYFASTQADDGGFSNNAYSTGMSLLALAVNYRFLPIYER